jgi:hypothetical protein
MIDWSSAWYACGIGKTYIETDLILVPGDDGNP